MNRTAAIFFLSTALVLSAGPSLGQELGGLPPIPDLDLGDPERKLSARQKRELDKKAERMQREREVYTRSPEDIVRVDVEEKVRKFGRANTIPRQREVSQQSVSASISSADDAMTASGARLQPFGDEGYWAGMPAPTPEETLIDLPPMPDLRTPDQVTGRERVRNLKVAKYEARKAEEEAKRRQKELERAATVDRPMPDPSTALVQVESQGDGVGSAAYYGNQEAPETVNNGNLKPFNEGSNYFRDNQLLYRGDNPAPPVRTWWRRGTNEPGGDSEGSGGGERLMWRNPFGSARDDVQPVSYGPAPEEAAFAADRPSQDATPLTSNLRGIRVVAFTREVRSSGLGGINGLVAENVDLPPRVQSVFTSRIGKSLDLGGLNEMVREAVLAYRKSDFPVVDVLVPEQEITSGVLQLVVIEGRLGDVLVEGAGPVESRALAGQIRTERGEVLRESSLSQDLGWINKHPTRQVDLIFSPGRGYGETDVILRSQAYKEISAYLAYENSGTEALGEHRAIFGASWVGPLFFGMDSILSYQFTTDIRGDHGDVFGHSGVFASYLPWRHQVTVLGAYVDSEALVDDGVGGFLTAGGVSKQLSGRYGIPLPNIGRMSHELQVGMDFKSSNSALAFGGLQVFDTTSEIVQYSLGYNIVARDQTGMWTASAEVYNSPGGATNKNNDAIFDSQTPGASATYTYGRVLLERDQDLINGWSIFARIQGQSSNGLLLASETLGGGGHDSVRGFESRIVSRDSGVVGSVELRTPTFYPSTFAGFGNVRDGAYGLLFYDAASLSNHTSSPGLEDVALGSVGLGFRYQKEEWFSLRVDYGFQVTEDGFEDGQTGRWHVGATATF